MEHVLEMPRRPDTPQAREAGEFVLRAGLSLAALVLALAAVWIASQPLALPEPPGRRLPFAASWSPAEASSWRGGTVLPSGLVVSASGANGAVATIVGGDGWRDYTVRARVRWASGRAMAFHVRERGPADFVACVLDGTTARIDEVSGGVTRTLASAPAPEYARRSFDGVVVVAGRHVAFTADGATLVSAALSAERPGTAGLAVWDPTPSRGKVVAEYVRVEPVAVPSAVTFRPPRTPSAEGAGSGE